jgi:hypothetical protein
VHEVAAVWENFPFGQIEQWLALLAVLNFPGLHARHSSLFLILYTEAAQLLPLE